MSKRERERIRETDRHDMMSAFTAETAVTRPLFPCSLTHSVFVSREPREAREKRQDRETRETEREREERMLFDLKLTFAGDSHTHRR